MTPGHAARKWTSIKKAGGGGNLYLLDWVDPRGQSHREILPFLEAVERRKIIAAELARAWNLLGLNRRGNQAMTRQEANKDRYDRAKAKSLCPRCQKNEVESNTQCPACLEYLRQYQRRLYYARKAEKQRLKETEAKRTPSGRRTKAGENGTTRTSNKAKRARTVTESPLPAKRRRGRPPRATTSAPLSKPSKSARTKAPSAITQPVTPESGNSPRRRGRPPKKPLPTATVRGPNQESPRPGTSRAAHRPGKQPSLQPDAPRKPGRPRKVLQTSLPAAPGKKGRTGKTSPSPLPSKKAASSPHAVTKRRRGRPPKSR